jgi:hypothetical protein
MVELDLVLRRLVKESALDQVVAVVAPAWLGVLGECVEIEVGSEPEGLEAGVEVVGTAAVRRR